MISLQAITQEDVRKIHHATLQILSETGIVLGNPEAQALLMDHGAKEDGGRMLLPADLVESCLTKHPAVIKLVGRDPERGIELGDGKCYVHNVGGVPNIYDPNTNTRRGAGRADVAQAARLLDALPGVASVTPHFSPQDVSAKTITLWMALDTFANTTKPFRAPGVQSGAEVKALAEMAQIVIPDGTMSIGISPISPLIFPDGIVEAIMETARQGLVLGPLPCPIMGATAPMSVAGAVAVQNAEVLASIVLGQLVNPGLRIIYKGRLSVMDPRTGLSVWGNPEIGMISAATVAMGHFYGIPVDVYGFCTNAQTLDIQNGYERAFNALMPVLAGADEISGVGEMDGGISSSFAQMVIDDEILASVMRLRRGFEVDEATLGLDIISEVTRGAHNFLSEAHTVKYLRSGEVLIPKLAVRENWAEWRKKGNQGILERANHQAQRILKSHEVPPLGDHQIRELHRIIKTF